MTAGARDQVGRLLALLPYLLAHPAARVADVAAVFGVSERQVVKDLNVLWFSGLPGLSMGDYIEVDMEAVADEGVVTVSNADYLARPLRLGTDEAVALVVALRTIAATPGLAERDAVDRVVAKLEHAAGEAAQRAAAVRVDVDPGHVDAAAVAEVVATVRRALDERRRLRMDYWVPTRDETTTRDVDPMRLALVDGRLYVEGWCHRAESVRLFRLDRVAQLRLLDEPSAPPPGAAPRDLAGGLFQPAAGDTLVTLELDPPARWVADHYPCEEVREAGAGRMLVRLRAADTRWVRRLLLRLGGQGRVLDPPELAAAVHGDAMAALRAYGAAPG